MKVKEDGTLYSDWQKAQDFYGGKNLIEIQNLKKTIYGVKLTIDCDAGTFAFNGTSTTTFEQIFSRIKAKPNTSYTLSGSPSGSSYDTWNIRCYEYNANNDLITGHYDFGEGVTFTTTENTDRMDIYFAVYSGVIISNVVFKPMLRLTDGTSDKFVPYAPTNKEIYNMIPLIPGNTYRRDITSRLNTSLYAEIRIGDFSNIKPGDILVGPVTGTNYWIAHRDLFYGYHNVGLISTHHVILLPTWILSSGQMNETNTTVGGYIASKGKTTVDQLVQDYFIKDFGNHIKRFRNFQVNATNSEGVPTGTSWYDTYGDLMSEINVYGSVVWSNSPMNTGIQKEQFEVFRDLGTHILGGTDNWLKDATHPWNFAFAYDSGVAHYIGAADTRGFRPFAVLVG